MNMIMFYQCEFCKEMYENAMDALHCEQKHLGITESEYNTYQQLLKDERSAYTMQSIENNERTRDACDRATEKVIKFQKEHNIPKDMEIKIL